MASAKDFAIDSLIQAKANKSRKGTVLGNSLRDGDHVLAVEWDDGSLAKVNVLDVEVSLSLEEEFNLFKSEVDAKLSQAAALIREAAVLAESRGKDLLSFDSEAEDSMFDTYQIERAMESAGWNTSSWHC